VNNLWLPLINNIRNTVEEIDNRYSTRVGSFDRLL